MNIARTNRTAWLGLGVLLLGVVAFGLIGFGHGPMVGYGERPFVGAGPWFWGFGLIGLVIRVAIWAGLLMLGMRLFRRMSARSAWDEAPRSYEATPLEILKRRYAAGEISRDQFDEMRRVLEPNSSAQA